MKLRHILCSILFFLSLASLTAENESVSGIELCNSVHSFLKKSGFSPSAQSLIISGENTFPYNIIVNLTPKHDNSSENLLLIFYQDDIPLHKELIRKALYQIQARNYDFGITALFAYGEKQKITTRDMIYGSQIFLDSINTNLDYTAIIFDLDSKRYEIETSASGLCSPPWLIQNSYNLYRNLRISRNLPVYLLSQISSYKFIKSRILESFFENDIPAIKLNLESGAKSIEKQKIAANIITLSVLNYANTFERNWEHHFLIVQFFGNYKIISEKTLLRIILPTVLVWIIFVLLLIFVNRRLKKHAWHTISKIWYMVPATFIIMETTFVFTGFLFKNLFPNASDASKIYGLIGFQIIVSLLFACSFFLLILTFNYKFEENSVDYLIVISCFINQSLFILFDISLCPIFIFVCTLSLIALGVKRNIVHILIFFFMIFPLVPYAHNVIKLSETHELKQFLYNSKTVSFIIPLVLYPVYIVIFRILTSYRSKTRTKKILYSTVATITAFTFVSTCLIILCIVRPISINKKAHIPPAINIKDDGKELIELSYSDKFIFNEIIRTLDINLKQNCIVCDVQLSTSYQNPILYSDNDYMITAANSAHFRIPDNPPKNMTFSYGANPVPCKITVSAVIKGENDNEYDVISRSINIGEYRGQ